MEYAASLGFITAVTTNGANFAHFPTKKGQVLGLLGASGRGVVRFIIQDPCACVCVNSDQLV